MPSHSEIRDKDLPGFMRTNPVPVERRIRSTQGNDDLPLFMKNRQQGDSSVIPENPLESGYVDDIPPADLSEINPGEEEDFFQELLSILEENEVVREDPPASGFNTSLVQEHNAASRRESFEVLIRDMYRDIYGRPLFGAEQLKELLEEVVDLSPYPVDKESLIVPMAGQEIDYHQLSKKVLLLFHGGDIFVRNNFYKASMGRTISNVRLVGEVLKKHVQESVSDTQPVQTQAAYGRESVDEPLEPAQELRPDLIDIGEPVQTTMYPVESLAITPPQDQLMDIVEMERIARNAVHTMFGNIYGTPWEAALEDFQLTMLLEDAADFYLTSFKEHSLQIPHLYRKEKVDYVQLALHLVRAVSGNPDYRFTTKKDALLNLKEITEVLETHVKRQDVNNEIEPSPAYSAQEIVENFYKSIFGVKLSSVHDVGDALYNLITLVVEKSNRNVDMQGVEYASMLGEGEPNYETILKTMSYWVNGPSKDRKSKADELFGLDEFISDNLVGTDVSEYSSEPAEVSQQIEETLDYFEKEEEVSESSKVRKEETKSRDIDSLRKESGFDDSWKTVDEAYQDLVQLHTLLNEIGELPLYLKSGDRFVQMGTYTPPKDELVPVAGYESVTANPEMSIDVSVSFKEQEERFYDALQTKTENAKDLLKKRKSVERSLENNTTGRSIKTRLDEAYETKDMEASVWIDYKGLEEQLEHHIEVVNQILEMPGVQVYDPRLIDTTYALTASEEAPIQNNTTLTRLADLVSKYQGHKGVVGSLSNDNVAQEIARTNKGTEAGKLSVPKAVYQRAQTEQYLSPGLSF